MTKRLNHITQQRPSRPSHRMLIAAVATCCALPIAADASPSEAHALSGKPVAVKIAGKQSTLLVTKKAKQNKRCTRGKVRVVSGKGHVCVRLPKSAPRKVPAKVRKAHHRQTVRNNPRTARFRSLAFTPSWYDNYRIGVGAECFTGGFPSVQVLTPIIKPLSGSYQWVAFKADWISNSGPSSYSDWWYGQTTNWGEYVPQGGWRFKNARTGAVRDAPALLHFIESAGNVRMNVAWYKSDWSLARHVYFDFRQSDYLHCF